MPRVAKPSKSGKTNRLHLFEVILTGDSNAEEVIAWGYDTRFGVLTLWCQGDGGRVPRVYAPGRWQSLVERPASTLEVGHTPVEPDDA